MSPFMLARAAESIRQFGFVDPVLVRSVPGTRGYEIVDGEHRWKAAKAVGLTHVLVLDLGDVSDHVAKRLTIVMNETRGQFDREDLSSLVTDLLSDSDETLNDLARKVLPYTDREIDKLTGSGLLTPGEAEPVGRPVAFIAGQTFRVKATPEQCRVISAAIASVRAAGDALTDGSALERICADFLAGR
jgi:ParB-like chromosome segregation protein Spo0J